ncbi:MAG: ATP-binding cassette domain-containing protein, partial [Woeseiaceae bacterium]
RCVAHGLSASFSVTDIVAEMTGEKHEEKEASAIRVMEGNTVLEVDHVTTAALPHPISIDCAAGEIIGIAGLAGAGRSELLEALFGLTPLTSGEVRRVNGRDKTPIESASQAVRHGIGFLGEDRQSMGLFPGLPVLANITLPGISSVASLFGLIDRKKEEAVGNDLVQRLGIRCASLHQDIDQLSGGNQQKALIARWIHNDSDIFLLDEPTRGVDVGTKNAIYALLFEMQSAGKTVILASSEIDELMTVCDRIIVLSDRQLVQVFEGGAWSETDILTAAFSNFMPGSVSPMGPARSNEQFTQ